MGSYPAISDHEIDRTPDRCTRRDRRNDRLGPHSALRLTECLRVSPGPEAGRSLHDRPPSNEEYVTKQLYFPDTDEFITDFMTPDGVGEVVDFMPIATPERATDRHRIVRLVRVVRGEMEFVLEVSPD